MVHIKRLSTLAAYPISMTPRIYWPHPLHVGAVLTLDDDQQRYLLRTLRLLPGARITLFTGMEEGIWQTTLTSQKPPQITVDTFAPCQGESPLSITLVQGVAKPEAMEWAIQKAVELGVAHMIPLLCRRSASNASGALTPNRQRRLQRIAIEAAEQSERLRVPTLSPPCTWNELEPLLPPGPRWLFWEEGINHPRLRQCPPPGPSVTLLVGPEGGLEPQEESFAREKLGFTTLGLGPRILRTETAAIAVITACQLLWGDIG